MLRRIKFIFIVLFFVLNYSGTVVGMNSESLDKIKQQNLKLAEEEITQQKKEKLEKERLQNYMTKVRLQYLQNQLFQELKNLKSLDDASNPVPDKKFELIKKLLNAIGLPKYDEYFYEETNQDFLKKIDSLCQYNIWKVDENKEKIDALSVTLTGLLLRKKITIILPAIEWYAEKNTPTISQKPSNSAIILQKIEIALTNLKDRNSLGLSIIDNDIFNVKSLWDQYKLEYNHTWLDYILHPFRESAKHAKLDRMQKEKPYSLLLHPDKYSAQNTKSIEDLFKYLGDTSKPMTSLDSAINTISPLASNIGVGQAITYGICFLNKVFPRLFKNRNFEKKLSEFDRRISFHQKETQLIKTTAEIKQKVVLFKRENFRDTIRDQIKKMNSYK